MHTTISHPETTAENLTEEDTPVFDNDGEYIGVVDVLLHQEGQGLAPPQETKPGRALRHNEALSSAMPLVLVRGTETGKETVMPGYYACVGTLPCADTDYYLLVRWEHREGGRQGERRVVLPAHIRVLDREALLLPSLLSGAVMPTDSSAEHVARQEEQVTPDLAIYHDQPWQETTEQGTPSLEHSSKRKP